MRHLHQAPMMERFLPGGHHQRNDLQVRDNIKSLLYRIGKSGHFLRTSFGHTADKDVGALEHNWSIRPILMLQRLAEKIKSP